MDEIIIELCGCCEYPPLVKGLLEAVTLFDGWSVVATDPKSGNRTIHLHYESKYHNALIAMMESSPEWVPNDGE